MKAQILYDFQEEHEFCSGSELYEFFREAVGEPSPSGHVDVPDRAAGLFVFDCLRSMEINSPSLEKHCKAVRAAFREITK